MNKAYLVCSEDDGLGGIFKSKTPSEAKYKMFKEIFGLETGLTFFESKDFLKVSREKELDKFDFDFVDSRDIEGKNDEVLEWEEIINYFKENYMEIKK